MTESPDIKVVVGAEEVGTKSIIKQQLQKIAKQISNRNPPKIRFSVDFESTKATVQNQISNILKSIKLAPLNLDGKTINFSNLDIDEKNISNQIKSAVDNGLKSVSNYKANFNLTDLDIETKVKEQVKELSKLKEVYNGYIIANTKSSQIRDKENNNIIGTKVNLELFNKEQQKAINLTAEFNKKTGEITFSDPQLKTNYKKVIEDQKRLEKEKNNFILNEEKKLATQKEAISKKNNTYVENQLKKVYLTNLGADINLKDSSKIREMSSAIFTDLNKITNKTTELSTTEKAQFESRIKQLQTLFEKEKKLQSLGNPSDNTNKNYTDGGNKYNEFYNLKNSIEGLGNEELLSDLNKVEEKFNNIKNILNKASNGELINSDDFREAADDVKEYENELNKLKNKFNNTNKGNNLLKIDAGELNKLQQLSNALAKYAQVNDKLFSNKKVGSEYNSLLNGINVAIKDKDVAALKQYQKQWDSLKGKIVSAGLEGQSVLTRLGNQMAKLGYYFSAAGIMMGFGLQIKKTIQNVIELDKVVTDLQIATGKTREETRELLSTYTEMGKVIGATTVDVATAADSWLN